MPNTGSSRRQKRKASLLEPTASALPIELVPSPVEAEIVEDGQVRFSGRGGSIRELARTLRDGWSIDLETRADAIREVKSALASPSLSARDRSSLTKVLLSMDRVRVEAEKLNLAAEIHGLHSVESTAPSDSATVETASAMYRRLVDSCETVEDLLILKRLRHSSAVTADAIVIDAIRSCRTRDELDRVRRLSGNAQSSVEEAES